MNPPDATADEALPGAQTVRRAMAILRLVACGQERGVRLIDLERMSGLNRPTVHRLLKTLIQEGAVEQDAATRRYLIGPEISLLGLARTRRFPLLTIADPYLAELADQVGDTVFLSVRHGHDSICIGRKTGHHPIQVLSIEVGVRRRWGWACRAWRCCHACPRPRAARLCRPTPRAWRWRENAPKTSWRGSIRRAPAASPTRPPA